MRKKWCATHSKTMSLARSSLLLITSPTRKRRPCTGTRLSTVKNCLSWIFGWLFWLDILPSFLRIFVFLLYMSSSHFQLLFSVIIVWCFFFCVSKVKKLVCCTRLQYVVLHCYLIIDSYK